MNRTSNDILFHGATSVVSEPLTHVGRQLHDPRYGYQLMSDTYIVNDIKSELANS